MSGNASNEPQIRFDNLPRWGIFRVFVTAAIGLFLVGCLGTPSAEQISPTETLRPHTVTFTPMPETPTLAPPTASPTVTASPEPTSIPLVWKQIYDGQSFMRDTVVSIVSDKNDPKTISITTANSGGYTTRDQGFSWIPAQTNHTQPDELFQVRWQGLDQSGRTVNYRINQENYTYLEKSIDNKNWIPIQKLTSWFYSNGPFTMDFNPTTKQAAFFSNRFLLYKTQDAGNSWFKVYAFPTRFIATIDVSVASPETVYAGTQGVFISKDGGSQWQEHSQGIGSIRAELLINSDNSRLYVVEKGNYGGQNNRIFRVHYSKDGGISWEVFSEQYGLQLSFGPGKTLYYSLDNGTILRFGDRWNGELFGYYGLLFFANPQQAQVLYSIDPNKSRWNNSGEASPIRVSLDDGKTWQETSGAFKNADTEDRLKLYFDHDQGAVIYAVLNNSILRSDNGGQSWNNCLYDIPLVDSESNLAIDPSNSSIVYVISETKGFYVSSNGCGNWQQRNIGLPYLGLNSIATDPNASNVIYAGTQSGAYISYDQGKHWGQINDGLIGNTIVYSIAVDSQSKVYAATPNGVFRLERR